MLIKGKKYRFTLTADDGDGHEYIYGTVVDWQHPLARVAVTSAHDKITGDRILNLSNPKVLSADTDD